MISKELEMELRAMIAVGEAGWRGSYSWHVFDWMCWRLRCKYPLVRKGDQLINTTTICC